MPNHPNSMANLKRWEKGHCPNPGGRPRKPSVMKVIRDMLELRTFRGEPLPRGMTMAEVLAEVLLAGALEGDFRCLKEVMERVDGKVVERVELTGVDGGPVGIDVTASLAKLSGEELDALESIAAKFAVGSESDAEDGPCGAGAAELN